jgi:hypothetical protein
MYMDWVVMSSLIVVALTCVIVIYIGIYAVKKIRKEVARAELEANDKT